MADAGDGWGFINRDEYSFEDSDRFEDDSQVSWESMDAIANQNWRGWSNCVSAGEAIQPAISCMMYQYQFPQSGRYSSSSTNTVIPRGASRNDVSRSCMSLSEMAARVCAEQLSFEELEDTYQSVCAARTVENYVPSSTLPEKIFLSIIVHCFPSCPDQIRMYSVLANGSPEQFNFGENLYQLGHVRNVVQIGFLLTAQVQSKDYDVSRRDKVDFGESANVCVLQRSKRFYNVSLKVDRCRVVSVDCSCATAFSWCQHVVALCLYRIHQASSVQYRVTIWDSVNELSHSSLRKFAQYLINELPGELLPIAQKFLDELKDPNSTINLMDGAPDPTDGGHEPVAFWSLDEGGLHTNIRKLLCKYCVPSPSVHCDVQYLATTQHPTTVEWHTFIKALRSREPEGMWNLVAMVREMMARRDENAVSLLRVLTEQCLSNSQVLLWWYITKLVQSGKWHQSLSRNSMTASQNGAQLNCAQLCDEVVGLWRCVAINPHADYEYRQQLAAYLEHYHRSTVSKIWGLFGGRLKTNGVAAGPAEFIAPSNHHMTDVVELQTQLTIGLLSDDDLRPLTADAARFCIQSFPGFCPALQICHALCEHNMLDAQAPSAHFNLEMAQNAELTSTTAHFVQPKKSKHSKKNKRKRGTRKTSSRRRHGPTASSSSRRDEENYESFAWVNEFNGILFPPVEKANELALAEEESTESGQESDLQQPTSSRRGCDASRAAPAPVQPEEDVDEALASTFLPIDALEARFVKCEAYATHGYMNKAVQQALKMVSYLLDSLTEQGQSIGVQLQKKCESTTGELFAMCQRFLSILEKVLYVTHVLRAGGQTTQLFSLIVSVMKIPKYPLATKFQQIKLYYFESEMLALLQQQSFSLVAQELDQLRGIAQHLIANGDGRLGDVPPIALAQYVFEKLSFGEGDAPSCSRSQPLRMFYEGGGPRGISYTPDSDEVVRVLRLRKPGDEELGLHAALTLLGANPTFPEVNHPLHFEAVRRQKTELAVVLFQKYKDSHEKLGLILDKLLDPGLHRMYPRHQSNAAYFLERDPSYIKYGLRGQRPSFPYTVYPQQRSKEGLDSQADDDVEKPASLCLDRTSDEGRESLHSTSSSEASASASDTIVGGNGNFGAGIAGGSGGGGGGGRLYDVVDVGRVPTNFIRPLMMTSPMPMSMQMPVQMQLRENPYRVHGVGLTKSNAQTLKILGQSQEIYGASGSQVQYRKKQKRRHYHALNPNSSATEAHVNHMTELAKRVLTEAGGNQSSVVFALASNLMSSAHRKLHLCAVIIGVYALGLHNRISPSWNTRTYSTSVSWINGQANEIGPMALEMIRETWTAHFTPSEVASIADKASSSQDHQMVEEAAKLALSVLPFAHSLAPQETLRALEQCKDQGLVMLEKALTAVETSADNNRHCVFAEVLFRVGRYWMEIAAEVEPNGGKQGHQQAMVNYGPRGGPGNPTGLGLNMNVLTFNNQSGPPPPPMPPPSTTSTSYMASAAAPPTSQQYYSNQPQAMMYLGMPTDASRLHQSHSAPQLGAPPPPPPPIGMGMSPVELPSQRILAAQRCGIRALESMAATPCDDRSHFLKYGVSPPFSDDVTWLGNISRQLSVSHMLTFFNTVARTILSPYMLHRFAIESAQVFPQRQFCVPQQHGPPTPQQQQQQQQQQGQQAMPQQPMINVGVPPLMHPMPGRGTPHGMANNAPKPIQYSGLIRNAFIQHGYHAITGELFERASEQYYFATVTKMTHPRFGPSDSDELLSLIHSAYDAFKWIPGPLGRNINDDFVRHVKKQKTFKKDMAMKLNNFFSTLC